MKIVCIGEAILDHYPDLQQTFPGGVAANYATNLAQQGVNVTLITRLGDDEKGRLFFKKLSDYGVDTRLIQWDSVHPTAEVDIRLNPAGNPEFRNLQTARAYHFLDYTEKAVETIKSADAIVCTAFSQMQAHTRASVVRLLNAPDKSRIFFDFNAFMATRESEEILQRILGLAKGVKMNNFELNLAARLLGISELPPVEQSRWLYDKYQLEFMVVSMDSRGALFLRGNEKHQTAPVTHQLKDTNGCGDAMGAAGLWGWLNQWNLRQIAETASDAAYRTGLHYGAISLT